jgi:hypothetical protein
MSERFLLIRAIMAFLKGENAKSEIGRGKIYIPAAFNACSISLIRSSMCSSPAEVEESSTRVHRHKDSAARHFSPRKKTRGMITVFSPVMK